MPQLSKEYEARKTTFQPVLKLSPPEEVVMVDTRAAKTVPPFEAAAEGKRAEEPAPQTAGVRGAGGGGRGSSGFLDGDGGGLGAPFYPAAGSAAAGGLGRPAASVAHVAINNTS